VEDERFYLILKSWIEFLKSLKIKPIVKFIDTQEKKDIFLSFKVDYIQGYEIAKPMDVAEFNQFLKEKL
jgi:EAL domain-containing protein (putative c-di-GMP-specific phosphodiesterase class I)